MNTPTFSAEQQRRIQIAVDHGCVNVQPMMLASAAADVPFPVACALFTKESYGGKNIWGNDENGMFSSLPEDFLVTKGAFEVFEWYVVEAELRTSNGVGPGQITWKGFFPDMRAKGLRAWVPLDNMTYGLELLHDYKAKAGATWEDAGTAYNGHRSYGIDFAEKVREFRSYMQ